MSVPDRLMEPYLKALSEWQATELAVLTERLADGSAHPRDVKKIVAGEVTAALHGVDAAMTARDEFAAQFSRRNYAEMHDLPVVADLSLPVVEIVKALGFAASNGEVRRVAEQKGLRLVLEPADGGDQQQVTLAPDEIREPLADILKTKFNGLSGDYYLKVGRRLARLKR
jgi:tyrosyl-tRNA synthetase